MIVLTRMLNELTEGLEKRRKHILAHQNISLCFYILKQAQKLHEVRLRDMVQGCVYEFVRVF